MKETAKAIDLGIVRDRSIPHEELNYLVEGNSVQSTYETETRFMERELPELLKKRNHSITISRYGTIVIASSYSAAMYEAESLLQERGFINEGPH